MLPHANNLVGVYTVAGIVMDQRMLRPTKDAELTYRGQEATHAPI